MPAPSLIAWRNTDRWALVLATILVFVLATVTTLLYVVAAMTRVDGDSMQPALQNNDRVLLTRGYKTPRAGDVIEFDAIDGDGREARLIKRVVAVAGDSVEMIGDIAYVNGKASMAAPTAAVGASTLRYGPTVVPEGTVYVLGDNRPIALDSRLIGPVPLGSVLGKAIVIVFPLTRIGNID